VAAVVAEEPPEDPGANRGVQRVGCGYPPESTDAGAKLMRSSRWKSGPFKE
jgi:hypothetical protein